MAGSFTNFFTIMVGAGATIVSLIYIALAMRRGPAIVEGAKRPEETSLEETFADSLLMATLGGFVVSSLAILPGIRLGYVVLPIACLSLLLIARSTVRLLQARSEDPARERWQFRFKSIGPVLVACAVVVCQLCAAGELLRDPKDARAMLWLAISVVGYYGYVLLRSWMLIGGAQRGLRAVFDPAPPARRRTPPEHGAPPGEHEAPT
jgi:hypothetical protein